MLLPMVMVGVSLTRRGLIAPASAALYYTKEDYCLQSETPNGIAFGCEEYANDEKRAKMRTRAIAEVSRAASQLDEATPLTVRRALREGPLGTLRRDGKRLVALGASEDEYKAAIAAIEDLDNRARFEDVSLLDAQRKLHAFIDPLAPAAT